MVLSATTIPDRFALFQDCGGYPVDGDRICHGMDHGAPSFGVPTDDMHLLVGTIDSPRFTLESDSRDKLSRSSFEPCSKPTVDTNWFLPFLPWIPWWFVSCSTTTRYGRLLELAGSVKGSRIRTIFHASCYKTVFGSRAETSRIIRMDWTHQRSMVWWQSNEPPITRRQFAEKTVIVIRGSTSFPQSHLETRDVVE